MSSIETSLSRRMRVPGRPPVATATAFALLAALAGCARDDASGSSQSSTGSNAEAISLEIMHDTWIKESPSLQGSSPRAGEMCFVFKGSKMTATAQGTTASGHRELRGVAASNLVNVTAAQGVPGGIEGAATAPAVDPGAYPGDGVESSGGVEPSNGVESPSVGGAPALYLDDSGSSVPSTASAPSKELWCSAEFLAARAARGLFFFSPHVEVRRPGSSLAAFSGKLYWPVPLNTVISSSYGMRGSRMHRGLDLAAKTGTPIRASATGRVIGRRNTATVGNDGGTPWGMSGTVASGFGFGNYGNVVLLAHGSSGGSSRPRDLYSLYAHQRRVTVAEGDEVETGDLLGEMGSTGSSTGPHLHFEIWRGGPGDRPNPLDFVQKAAPP